MQKPINATKLHRYAHEQPCGAACCVRLVAILHQKPYSLMREERTCRFL